MLVKVSNGAPDKFPYNISELSKEHPNVSFPSKPEQADLSSYGVYTVTTTAPPPFDNKTHRLVQGVTLVDGVWTQTWTAQELPVEQASSNIRQERNRRLSETDWRITLEVEKAAVDNFGLQVPIVWTTYRQALRDITTQPGFPYNVTWPTEPTT